MRNAEVRLETRCRPSRRGRQALAIGFSRDAVPPGRRATALLLAVALTAVWHGDAGAQRLSTREAVRRAASYVVWFDTQLPSLVADEHYVQRTNEQVRVLDSEIAWVPAGRLDDVLAVRDVHAVDGHAVARSRIADLLRAGPSTSILASEMLRASASYNLGAESRNVNFPTFALVYLRGNRADRLRWRSRAEPDGRIRLRFEERNRPTVVRDGDGRSMRADGEFVIDPASGRIERSVVTVTGTHERPDDSGDAVARHVTYTLTVTFAANDRLGLWLPARMDEQYEQQTRGGPAAGVTGEAQYSNYRRFETEGRIIER
jgi:hypothetical protein